MWKASSTSCTPPSAGTHPCSTWTTNRKSSEPTRSGRAWSSLRRCSRPGRWSSTRRRAGQDAPVLVYNVSPTTDTAAGLWQQQEEDRTAALSDLLGHTRANVLESLRSPVSISEISRRLDLSHHSVSRHLGVLRRSAMVAAERRDNLTLHRLTHLGEAVLGRKD
ncbi:ArsR/SmtB family transcription factor [Streptomyces massasporeus]|uniref:ArsR/SmtB family transcription factor n=1 Tax=Streptomyces massasporeus TaxID=67324 RepID=UPI0036E7F6F5